MPQLAIPLSSLSVSIFHLVLEYLSLSEIVSLDLSLSHHSLRSLFLIAIQRLEIQYPLKQSLFQHERNERENETLSSLSRLSQRSSSHELSMSLSGESEREWIRRQCIPSSLNELKWIIKRNILIRDISLSSPLLSRENDSQDMEFNLSLNETIHQLIQQNQLTLQSFLILIN